MQPIIAVYLVKCEETGSIAAQISGANCLEIEHEQQCRRCAADDSDKPTLRQILLCVAICWCFIIFGLDVGYMTVSIYTASISIVVAIWVNVTLFLLVALLWFGRLRYSHHPLSRTGAQIKVLSGLAVSWLLLMVPIMKMNFHRDTCLSSPWPIITLDAHGEMSGLVWQYDGHCVRLFTAAHAFSWILIVTLLLAAYTTYCRGVQPLGAAEDALPLLQDCRLSDAADAEGSMHEGTLKIGASKAKFELTVSANGYEALPVYES
ncbi:hypothetical protein R3P38DRAFT_2879929 [Favolaschia claudopus]|uniref:Uncharacterized protein n=1 Tax=Favolaschia claudopus TaxID=2862362 RepID=A0AAW0CZJ0_9AGAR